MDLKKGQPNKGKNIEWSEQEFEILRKYFPLVESEISKEELVKKLPSRTWSAIQVRANAIHLVRGKSLWKRGELFILRKLCFNCGIVGVPKAKLIEVFKDKSWEAISEKIKYLELDKIIAEKRCSHCKETKPVTEFGINFKTSDSYKSWCNSCSQSTVKHYYEQHPEKQHEIYRRGYESLKGRYRTLTSSARSRKINLNISLNEFAKFLEQVCYYCELPLDSTGVGLDRINNDKTIGYTADNVLPCCTRCNKTRGDWWTVEETKCMIKAVLQFQKSEGGLVC